ncbi:MAG: LPS export ABC transporter periplasmic protein LptC, partial [Selenomonas artemidis]
MMTKKLYRGVLLLLAAAAVGTAASAAQPGREPTNLTADSLTYDTRTGVVTAEANVRMEQGTGWVEGVRATYNTRTEEGTVEGGVRAMREDMQLSCDRLFAQGQNHWQATGSVRMVKADRTFTGPQADYYPAQNDYLLA